MKFASKWLMSKLFGIKPLSSVSAVPGQSTYVVYTRTSYTSYVPYVGSYKCGPYRLKLRCVLYQKSITPDSYTEDVMLCCTAHSKHVHCRNILDGSDWYLFSIYHHLLRVCRCTLRFVAPSRRACRFKRICIWGIPCQSKCIWAWSSLMWC